MRYLILPFFLTACLPTGTGNPLADAATGSDAGGAFDAAASDSGPQFPDSGPAGDAGVVQDGGPAADASAPDSGVDAGCSDAGPPGCGTTGGASCDCLAGDPLALGEGRPLLLADHGAEDGRVTLIRQRIDTSIESRVLTSAGGAAEATHLLAANVAQVATTAAGEAFSIAYMSTELDTELNILSGVIDTGMAIATPQRFIHSSSLGLLAVARAGTTTTAAFVSESEGALEAESVFVVQAIDGVAGTRQSLAHANAGLIRAIDIRGGAGGWLLAFATPEAVFTQRLDASASAVGEAREVASTSFVSELHLVARADEGFVLSYDGATPALHVLDAEGVSTNSMIIEGRVVALEWSGAEVMLVRSDALSCSTADSPLAFERFDVDGMPLHEAVRVGAGDSGAALALVDGSPWVVSSSMSALSLTNACLDDE